jgi:hypothetical protein
MEGSSMEDSILVSMADVASEADFGGPAWRSGSVWVRSPRPRITTLPPTIRLSTIRRHRCIISRPLKGTVRRRAAAVRVAMRALMFARWIIRSPQVQAATAPAITVRGCQVGQTDGCRLAARFQDLRDTTAGCAYGAKPSVTNRQPEFLHAVFRLDGDVLEPCRL